MSLQGNLASLTASNAIFRGANSNDVALYTLAGQSVWIGNQMSSNSVCVTSNNGTVVNGNLNIIGNTTLSNLTVTGTVTGISAGGGVSSNQSFSNVYSSNVGIGTKTPAFPLDVMGNARVTGTFTTSNEIQTNSNANSYRLAFSNAGVGNYGVFHRNDGGKFYLMTTSNQDPNGSWNMINGKYASPFEFGLSTMDTSIAQAAIVAQAASGNVTVRGTLTAPTFVGALSGNATTATTAGGLTSRPNIDVSTIKLGDYTNGSSATGYVTINGQYYTGEYLKIQQNGGSWGTNAFYNAARFITTAADAGGVSFNVGPGGVAIGRYPPLMGEANVFIAAGNANITGNLAVNGSVSKASGTFDIPHPLHMDNSNQRLVHSFIEGPRCDLIYRGMATLSNGTATVNIDSDSVASPDCAMEQGTFVSLCTNPQMFLQNTSTFDRVIGSIEGNTLTISCENSSSSAPISWMVVAERHDPYIKLWERTNEDGYLVTEYTSSNVDASPEV